MIWWGWGGRMHVHKPSDKRKQGIRNNDRNKQNTRNAANHKQLYKSNTLKPSEVGNTQQWAARGEIKSRKNTWRQCQEGRVTNLTRLRRIIKWQDEGFIHFSWLSHVVCCYCNKHLCRNCKLCLTHASQSFVFVSFTCHISLLWFLYNNSHLKDHSYQILKWNLKWVQTKISHMFFLW